MATSDAFGEAVRKALGARTLREAEALCGVDHTTIYQMTQGHVPKRQAIAAFADGLSLGKRARTGLFRAAGLLPDFEPAQAVNP